MYPAVELTTALLFVVPIFGFNNWTSVLLWLVLVTVGVPLTVIDITLHRLPDRLTTTLALLSATIIVGDALIHHHYSRLIPTLIGALALPAFYLALMIISRGGMGMGDVKLAIGIGMVSGFFGVRTVLVSSFAAYILGSAIGIGLMIAGKAGRKTAIPFGPFMLVGQAIALVFAARSGL
jgi:leader peptidase (prepilin peptidase)/N-methyltransferase